MYLSCKGSSNIDANFCFNITFPQNFEHKNNEETLKI